VPEGKVPPLVADPLPTWIWNGFEALAPTVSVARMRNATVAPAALLGGVPLRVFPVRLNHDGRPVADHVSEPVPPVAANEAL